MRKKIKRIELRGVLYETTVELIDWGNGKTQRCLKVTPITNKKEKTK